MLLVAVMVGILAMAALATDMANIVDGRVPLSFGQVAAPDASSDAQLKASAPRPVKPQPNGAAGWWPAARQNAAATVHVAKAAATVETDPVPSDGDAADDPAFWIHPTDSALSTVIGTDKRSGLAVYDLSGNQLQFIDTVEPNNVDVRYNFPLGGNKIDLVAFSDENFKGIGIFKVNPATRLLQWAAAREIKAGATPYGFCMYHSRRSGKFHAIVTSKSGRVEQWELFDNGKAAVDAILVRSFDVGDQTEGCVADDVHAALYVAEEDIGIWKYGAEPTDGAVRTLVDSVANGHLNDDVEGLAIYYASDDSGYLIASSQGASEFVIYDRQGKNDYRATFRIVASQGVDAVTGTDGIEVVNAPLGTSFPKGAFAAQDGDNQGGKQNFKLVPWQEIARAIVPALTVDTAWNARMEQVLGDAQDRLRRADDRQAAKDATREETD